MAVLERVEQQVVIIIWTQYVLPVIDQLKCWSVYGFILYHFILQYFNQI